MAFLDHIASITPFWRMFLGVVWYLIVITSVLRGLDTLNRRRGLSTAVDGGGAASDQIGFCDAEGACYDSDYQQKAAEAAWARYRHVCGAAEYLAEVPVPGLHLVCVVSLCRVGNGSPPEITSVE